MQRYLQSCKTEFWKKVFKAEADYVLQELEAAKDVLSVGCGPAIIEAALSEHGFDVTGLDISKEALDQAPDSIRKVAGSAENMDFADSSFDAVIYVASLQFIEEYRQAIKETARVLRSGGKLLAMLLNPKSQFYRQKAKNASSYISKIKHPHLARIQATIAQYFSVRTEYFLGINGKQIFQTQNPDLAALYVIKGTKKDSVQGKAT